MIRVALAGTAFLVCGFLAVLPSSSAQSFRDAPHPSAFTPQKLWWAHGWGFAGSGVHRIQDTAVRQRLTGLFHLAHAQVAAQACDDVEVSDKATRQLFGSDSFGRLSAEDHAFVAQQRSELAGKLTLLAGGEACEWAYENYGPKGAMQPGLIRAKDPETTSSVQVPLLLRLVPLPPRRPVELR